MPIVETLTKLNEFHRPRNSRVPLSDGQRKHVEQFNHSASAGEFLFEEVACLCGAADFDLIASVDRYALKQRTVLCRRCGLIQSNPRMTENSYARFYKSDTYRRCYEAEDYMKKYEDRYNTSTGRHILETVLKVKPGTQIKSVLEFGAGGGWNLVAFQEAGFAVKGIDHSESLAALGRKQAIDVQAGTISDIRGNFDVIILNHVVEHFSDPVASVSKIKPHLKPGGIIYIAVPDIRNFDMAQLQNAHTYYFTPKTLAYYMGLCGLQIALEEPSELIHWAAVFKDGTSTVTLDSLKQEYERLKSIIRAKERRRLWVGMLETIGVKDVLKKVLGKGN